MAKKTIGVSKTPPKSEARPLGTKKPVPPPKAKPKPKAKPEPEPEPEPESHEREFKPVEVDLIQKRRATVAHYLTMRDGMDDDLAASVVEGMEPEEIGDLWQEAMASDFTMDRTDAIEAIAAGAAEANAPDAMPEFTDIEALANSESFPELLIACIEDAKIKNAAEKRYKDNKAKLIELLKEAGVNRNEPLAAFGNKLERYQGSSPKYLDPQKLLEKGVSIDIINQCYKSTKYEDVRITVPKE